MGNTAIRVQELTKFYRIGTGIRAQDSFATAAWQAVKSPLANYRKYRALYRFDEHDEAGESSDVIRALSGISFEVAEGDVVGILGHNGAGKSTLLKILSRITPPTRGRVELHGRISSLLEVGTGFHQELTGRENIYLNGTILGMRKREVDRKFDEIVAFSGVERFLDTPIKRYSSGMRVRLAFSVAAHLEPEILIIDEVLAVGDAEFQKKCINKMQDVGRQGRTVLFVSHNMPAILSLCSRGILINGGRLVEDGPIQSVVEGYSQIRTIVPPAREWSEEKAPGGDSARLLGVRVTDRHGTICDAFDIREPIRLELLYEVTRAGCELLPHLFVYNEEGVNLFGTLEDDARWRGRERHSGIYRSTVTLPGNLLAPGRHYVNCSAITLNPNVRQFVERSVVAFQVIDTVAPDSARGDWAGPLGGVMRPKLSWDTEHRPVITARAAP